MGKNFLKKFSPVFQYSVVKNCPDTHFFVKKGKICYFGLNIAKNWQIQGKNYKNLYFLGLKFHPIHTYPPYQYFQK